MQISNGHPDTPSHVWTTHGYLPRSMLAHSQARQEDERSVTLVDEYRVTTTRELVRRDCRMVMKQRLVLTASAGLPR